MIPILAAFLVLAGFAVPVFAQAPADAVTPASLEQVAADLKEAPCRINQRLKGTRVLFEKMNAKAPEMSVQKVRGADNLVITRPGRTAEKIVVGAHYDFAELGCGAVDNWTGIVALAHIYNTVRQFPTTKTVLFVAFGNEETGLLGSRGMVDAIPKEDLPQYCAMINIDSFGLGTPFALKNISSDKLVSLGAEVAKGLQIPFYDVVIREANSDSSSFIAKGIPSVTLSGLNAEWMSILHTHRDQVERINPTSVYLGYRLALEMLLHMDQSSCESYRDPRDPQN